ncbi:hypothetical protein [Virgibacillus salexigens]|uniref:Uncharacterized protein n=1 Tax=Virgibacillus massiliensis TaxID=1462526 RepID=A0A024QIH0_9BACI|nr:hypothetical protein [Virgibacillus massiliensis]CDQ41761.1 hypothetical protein BN990_04138 [Virgibacillus massiliensis]
MSEVQEKISNRMRKIGSKKNFSLESGAAEIKKNDKLINVNVNTDGGVQVIDLILEPHHFDELSSEVRLNFDEYCNALNDFIDEEEDDWKSLRMKDQVNMTSDHIIKATIIKYAKEKEHIDVDKASGIEISYLKRHNEKGMYLGEAINVTLTIMPQLGIN